MVEFLAAGMTGDYFSYEAAQHDNNDGGPAKGGEFVCWQCPRNLSRVKDGRLIRRFHSDPVGAGGGSTAWSKTP